MSHENPSWRPPAPSNRSRGWNRKTGFSGRSLAITPQRRELHCESFLEANAVVALYADLHVVSVEEQPKAVSYVNDAGVTRPHTIDMIATLRDTSRVAVLVKPVEKAKEIGLQRLMELLAAQVPRSVADRFVHLHEGKLTRDVIANGDLLMGVRRDGPFSGDPAVVRMAAAIDRPMRIEEGVVTCGVTNGFRAIARLLLDGVLDVSEGVRIEGSTLIRPSGSSAGRVP